MIVNFNEGIFSMENPKRSISDYRLGIIAGVHGDEPGSVLIANDILNIFKEMNEIEWRRDLVGYKNIDILSVANPSGIIYNDRRSLNDGNLNNINFQDDKNKILKFISEHDIIIDIHCSRDICDCFVLNSECFKSPRIKKMIDIYNDYVDNKTLYIKHFVNYSSSTTIKDITNSYENKLGFTFEAMGMDSLTENEEIYYSAKSLVEFIKFLPDLIIRTATEPEEKFPEVKLYTPINTSASGLVKYNYIPGQYVHKGDVLATIISIKNLKIVQEIKSPIDGTVMARNINTYVNFGANIMSIQGE